MKQKQTLFKKNAQFIVGGLAIVVFGTALLLTTNFGRNILGVRINPLKNFASQGKFRSHNDKVPNEYIVVFKNDVSNVEATATELNGKHLGQLKHVYQDALKGFSTKMTETEALALSEESNVDYVEEDIPVKEADSQSTTWQLSGGTFNNWSFDRIDQRTEPLDQTYNFTATGRGVNIYMIDYSVWTGNPDFTGRASVAYSAVGGADGYSCNSHGTGTTGVAAGATIGPAKNARIYSVNIAPCTGFALLSDVLQGIDWVTRHGVKPAVVNMSIQSTLSSSFNDAVAASINKGFTNVAAAGNNTANACNYSPSSVSGVIAVGATGNNGGTGSFDDFAPWSNFGPCVSVFAPGIGDRITLNGVDTAATGSAFGSASGTSFAAPYVTGVAATYLETHPTASPAEVKNAIIQNATPNVVNNIPANTANRLLYSLLTTVSSPPPGGTDTTPPTVNITAPANGIFVKKSLKIAATASDSSGIAQIVLNLDGTVIKTCLSITTCSANTNTGSWTAGSHTITATATDNASPPNTNSTSVTVNK